MAKILAYQVTENEEQTGGIVFANSAVKARRIGANEYADGDFSYVSCRRAQWADDFYKKEIPVSLMVEEGWHFDCYACGQRIDNDNWWDKDWNTDDIIGTQYSLVYCNAICEAVYALDRAKSKYVEKRWLRRFAKIVKKRFPDASPQHHHAFASRDQNGIYKLLHVSVEFVFPNNKYGKATLRWDSKASYSKTYPKPYYSVCNGDKAAFDEYCLATKKELKHDED
jgi:hypothetical protein